MKALTKHLHWILAAVFGLWFVSATFRPAKDTGLKAGEFGKLPVILNGRLQPWDSVARNALLQIREKQSISYELLNSKGEVTFKTNLTALQWMMEVMFLPDIADGRPVFRIDHPDVKGLLGFNIEEKHFAWDQIAPSWEKFYPLATNASAMKSAERRPYEQGLLKLLNASRLYIGLKFSATSPRIKEPAEDLLSYVTTLGPGMAAFTEQQAGKTNYDSAAFEKSIGHLENYAAMAQFSSVLALPPLQDGHEGHAWSGVGAALMDMFRRGEKMPDGLKFYAVMASAFRAGDAAKFNGALADYQSLLAKDFAKESRKGGIETFFNKMEPFYRSMVIYIAALLLGLTFWIVPSEAFRRSAVWLVGLGFVIHTAGLVFRIVLEGRPPVTNLYSSAIFIGWGSIILGLGLERIYKDAIGLVVASFMGFVTLIVAHNLALGGDTLHMLEAVLDTNFWLATHVVIVTLGYAATFVAGLLAIIFVVRGFFTPGLSRPVGLASATVKQGKTGETLSKALARMTYAILCFATLFSFVGTVLGGIWADQSWGRFWGWDPKENGALMIVLWNALILHARWGGLVKERGIAVLAIAGNIMTAWSWFGTNMLGVGLHSYGFNEAGFKWLMFFITTQVLLIGVGLLPLRLWASFAASVPSEIPASGKAKPRMA